MTNEATRHPDGVPLHVALETFSDPALVSAWREAMAVPIDSLPRTAEMGDPPRSVILPDPVRLALLARPALGALMDDLHRKLRAGAVVCAGRAEASGDGPTVTFSTADWEGGAILRSQYEADPTVELDGLIYSDLLFRRVAPMPPPEGWDLQEASFALLTDLDWRAWNMAVPRQALGLLAPELLRTIFARRDLRITGRNFDAPPEADRIVLSRDYAPGRLAANTFIRLEILDSAIVVERPNGQGFRLDAVLIEAVHFPEAGHRAEADQGRPTPATPRPAQRPPAAGVVNRGGRPAKFDRIRIGNRLREIANTPDGLPSDASERRDLVRAIATEVGGEEPAPSTLADIMRDLDLR